MRFWRWTGGNEPSEFRVVAAAAGRLVQCLRGVGDGFATIMLQNRLHGDVDCSVLCTTHKAETWFGFNYLQFMGLYSKSPKLAFNQKLPARRSLDRRKQSRTLAPSQDQCDRV